jgi:hypothetical protein
VVLRQVRISNVAYLDNNEVLKVAKDIMDKAEDISEDIPSAEGRGYDIAAAVVTILCASGVKGIDETERGARCIFDLVEDYKDPFYFLSLMEIFAFASEDLNELLTVTRPVVEKVYVDVSSQSKGLAVAKELAEYMKNHSIEEVLQYEQVLLGKIAVGP